MYKVNPYRPEAGTSPLYLAGREIDENEINGIAQRHKFFTKEF